MHSGKKWRSALWLNAMHSSKKWWLREFVPPYILRLNPDYVAARLLRSLRSNKNMFSVFKRWPRISKVVLKSILLTFNLVYCRFKFDRYSYNSCTQPSKRQPHKHSSRNSDERGRIPRAFKDVLTHLKIMRFGVVFGVRGRIRINLKGTCLERNWRVAWYIK